MSLPTQVPPNILLFHAGTKNGTDQQLLTNGGRVLSVTAIAETISQAAADATEVAAQVQFEGATFRSDIGYEF